MNLQSKIRGFLLIHPKPALIRVTQGDGTPQEIKLSKSFARTADTIVALGVDLIELCDKQGNLLRAMRLDTPDMLAREASPVPSVLSDDPNAAMLTHFANLLHRAYEHSTEIAFTKMVELVERIGDRSEAIEQRLERTEAAHRRTLEDNIDAAMARAEEAAEQAEQQQAGGLDQLANAFLGGMAQPKAAPPNHSNGRAKS